MSALCDRKEKAKQNTPPIELPPWEAHVQTIDAETQTESKSRPKSVPRDAFVRIGASLVQAAAEQQKVSKDDWEVVQRAQSV